MSPTPQEHHVMLEEPSSAADDERIVISGISGLFPQSRHVKDLSDILYNKKNPISEETCRWKYTHPEVSNFTGNVPGLEYFDAQFFKVHYRLADSMDCMGKKVLEMTYQAIYDAGINPHMLSGKKVGVYIGSSLAESEKAIFYDSYSGTGFGIAGCSKTMFANRISYYLNVKGPSMAVDESCCSSLVAFEQAYQAIARGECEAAIVGGGNVCLHPQSSLHYARVIKMSKDGKTKSFDENADGCVKSEAINVLFLQKAKYAKRIYAEVLHVKNIFHELVQGETGPRYGFYRDPMNLADFLKTFYKEAKIPAQAVEYVEAFGSAEPEADRSELEAIGDVFCEDRRDTLLVGSVMSNIGYGEAASGISAIIKVLLGYQKGEMAANLHCEKPRYDITAIRDGKMEIITDHKKFRRTYTAINAISVTGVNAHVLLKGNYKPKDFTRYRSAIPHLVTISARQDTYVQNIIDDLKSRSIDPEELALLHNIHQIPTSGHLGRGYVILGTNTEGETTSLAETANYFDDVQQPLWFVYSGMGSQWIGMGAQLMRIPIFAAAIERCRKVLEPKGVDIVHIITSQDKTIFDNILNSFVGIAAIQIGLTDILTALGLVPDKIIGHSVGELGCAYADGCFTAEEMILAAYSRGLVSVQTPLIKGSMAAVGLGYQQIKDLLPQQIVVACHNGPESSTISGPADVMKEFVAKLAAKGIFAREVPCSNIAFHSRYIAEAGPGLLNYLTEVIKNPKPRSEKWLSTSIPREKWNEPLAKYSSAEYHTNNLLNPVLFEETSRLVPANAVLVEIAPHGLLQAILKRSLPESCKHIPLTRRGHTDNAFLVLDAIGKLYMEGYNPKIENLYPKIKFPVSTGTPMLSHLVEWAHQEKWYIPLYCSARKKKSAATNNIISTHDDEHIYLKGHVIRGKNLYPFSAVLVAVWDTIAMVLGKQLRNLNVEFTDVHLYVQPPMYDQRQLRLSVTWHRGTGSFEVLDDDRKVARGYIVNKVKGNTKISDMTIETNENLVIKSDDVYQIMRDRDYDYKDEFRSIHKVNTSYTEAQIIWNDNWVTFLDGILQLHVLRNPHNTVSLPIYIRELNINTTEHFNKKISVDGKNVMIAQVFDLYHVTSCGGVMIKDIQMRKLPPLEEAKVALNALNFVPRLLTQSDVNDTLQVYLQMVSENVNKDSINVVEILNNDKDLSAFEDIRIVLDSILGLTVNYKTMAKAKALELRDYIWVEVDLVVVKDLSTDSNLFQTLYNILPRDMFIINVEKSIQENTRPSTLYRIVSVHNTMTEKVELVKWRPSQIPLETTVASVRSTSDISLLTATRNDLPQRHKLVVISTYPPVPGLKDLVKEWRKEIDRNQIYLIMVSEKDNLDELPELDLAYSVFNTGVWGGEYLTTIQDKVSAERGITLGIGKFGDLNNLQWVEKTEPTEPGIAVTVHYAAINNLDVKTASGVFPMRDGEKSSESSYCMDFSGVTDSGVRVMGILPSGAASSRIVARPELLWPVPKHWSLEDAVTVPSAYLNAFYCYEMKLNFRHGYKVLIHGGAGALGQAAISVALGSGCEVFTTVSNIHKKKFLMKLFPELKDDHIGNSRDHSFGDMVMNLTRGKGCDVVICCVQGELKDVSLKVCGSFGVAVDTTQISSNEKFKYGMHNLTLDRNYTISDFRSLVTNNTIQHLKMLQPMMSEGIAKGYVRPLSRVTYIPHEVSRAFRLLASSRHRGRVVLRLRDSIPVPDSRLLCSPDGCHIVICDEDTIGIQLTDRLIIRGAKKLYLHCQQITSYLRIKKEFWENLGVKVLVSSEDLSNSNNIATLLDKSTRLGPVEGVYVLAANVMDQTIDKLTGIVDNLDRATRKLHLSIRYFAVVSAGFDIGGQTCLARVKYGLPATNLNITTLIKEGTEDCKQGWNSKCRSVVTAIERAICTSQPTLLAVPERKAPISLLQQINNIADIKLSEATPDHISLQDMGIDFTQVTMIQNFLRDVHNISFAEEDIPKLTILKIRNLEEVISGPEFKEVRGLATFFSHVDPDELMATTELVFLPSLTNSGNMSGNDFDVSKRYFCIIPGMEGHHEKFRVLCERLKMPVIVLQPGLDLLHESIQETVERYAKLLLKRIDVKNNFYLLAYESGIIIALEVAAILEEQGLTGTVFCVGGTPEEFQATLLDQISEYETEEALQDAVARYMFRLMTGNTEGLDQALENVLSWNEKVEACVRTLLGKVPHSAQYARAWINAAYTRIAQMRSYKLQSRQLRSKLILLRASSLSTGLSLNEATTLMQRYSKQPVVVYQLQASLADATYDLRCGAIINRHLDDEIKQIYNESNRCVDYVVDADSF